MKKSKIKKVKTIFKKLLSTTMSTTSLDVKYTLRINFPKQKWNQDEISEALIDIEQDSKTVTYTDNGIFRTYHYVMPKKTKKTKKKISVNKISRTAMVELIKDSKGKFFTVQFTKVNGDIRTLNGNVKKKDFMDNLGYIRVTERNSNKRLINPKTLKSLSISGAKYILK